MKLPWQHVTRKTESVSPQQSSYGITISIALGGKPYYEGTVDRAITTARRRRNKAARIARRAHR